MAIEFLTHTKKYSVFAVLDRNDADDEALGHVIAQLVMNWARLDYALYTALRAKDHEKAAQWMRMLLEPHLLGQRIEIAKKELAEIAATDDEYVKLLNDTFDRLDEVREKRNLLVHGLWYREDRETFRITPMQLDAAGEFVLPVELKRSEIHDLVRQMQTVIEGFAQLRAKTRFHVARGKTNPQSEKTASPKS